MSAKSKHVVTNPSGGWSVRNSGAARASRVFKTEGDAVKYAREVARHEGAELYVHRRDGTVRERESYGAERLPPRDRR
jgi:hypothetical protein